MIPSSSVIFFLVVLTAGAIIFYDLRYRIIPDILILFLLVLIPLYYPGDDKRFLYAGSLGIGGVLLKFGMEKLLKRPALGWGDIKLTVVLGLGLTLEQTPFFLASAGLIGCAWGTFHKIIVRESDFPFAPSLILGFLLATQFL